MIATPETTTLSRQGEERLQPRKYGQPIFFALGLLLVIGCFTLYSVTSFRSAVGESGDQWRMWAGQFKGYVIGLFLFMVGYYVSPRRWITSYFAYPTAVGLVLLLGFTAFSPMGQELNDARRWLKIGSFGFQPSELAKFVLPVFLIYLTGPWKFHTPYSDRVTFKWGVAQTVVFIMVPLGLIFNQPDLGTAAVVGGLCCLPMLRWVSLSRFLLIPVVLSAVSLLLMKSSRFPEIGERFRAIWNPQSVPQVWASLQAIGSGGLFGKGLGEGAGKLGYIPSSYNDFIFAVYAEETGFLGVLIVILLYGTVLHCGRKLWRSIEDEDLSLLAMVITLSICGQAAFNLLVNLALAPTKGIALPLFSHGSTSLAIFMGMAGVLLALTRCRGKEVWNS